METTAKIKALKEQIESGKIKSVQAKILNYAQKRKGFFIRELESIFNIARSTATARVSELEDMGLIKYHCAMKTKYAKAEQGYFRVLTDPEDQRKHRFQREYEKRDNWIKKGQKHGWLDETLSVVR